MSEGSNLLPEPPALPPVSWMRQITSHWIIVVLAVTALAISSGYDIIDDRHDIIAHEQDRILTQAKVIEVNLDYQLESVSSAVRSLFKDLHDDDINQRLAQLTIAMPGVRTLVVLDKAGIATASNRRELIGKDFSSRDYFTVPRDSQHPEKLFISPPYKGALNQYIITLSVIVPGKDGGFNGVIGASLDPDYFSVLLNSVLYTGGMWSSILHSDGLLFVMIPAKNGMPGTDLAVPGTFFTQHKQSGKNENLFTGISYLSGDQRIAAFRSFAPPGLNLSKPLIIAVSRDLDSVLVDWKRDSLLKTLSVLLLGVFLVVGTLFLQRRQQMLKVREQQLVKEQAITQYEIRRSKEINSILNSMQSTIVVLDRTGIIINVNQIWSDFAADNGGSPELQHGIGLNYFDVCRAAAVNDPDILDVLQGVMSVQQGTEKRYSTEYPCHGPAVQRWFTMHVSPRDDCSGGVVLTHVNITERRVAEESLRETNELFSLFMRHSPVYAYIKEVSATESRILMATDNFIDMIGVPVSAMLGAVMDDLFPPELAERYLREDLTVVSSGKVLQIEEELNGRYYTTIKFPIVQQGKILLAGYTIDITERKLAEVALKQKDSEMEQFFYSVSHDLRSPLVTVKTFLGYLVQDMATGNHERISQDVEFIRGAADKMELMLNELLELSRIGRLSNNPADISFRELAEDACTSLAGTLSETHAIVDISPLTVILHGDRQRFAQIWQNLLENALKYRNEATPPHIEVGVEERDSGNIFYVRDNGIGIAPAYKQRIFGLFKKLDANSSGVGLGLAMVKRIVELYGGEIWVESAGEGHGSCFRFTLPGAMIGGGGG